MSKTEEVFAENYDEDNSAQSPALSKGISPVPIIENGTLIHESAACPNQSNVYHECASYCFERYGRRSFRGDQRNGRLRDKMLRRYPLPSHWIEVGDPVTGRFYYWNTASDEVSWLSPLHPRARISKPASVLKAQTLRERDAARAAAAAASAVALAQEEEANRDGSDEEARSRSPSPPPPPPPLLATPTSAASVISQSVLMPPPSGPPPPLLRNFSSTAPRRPPRCMLLYCATNSSCAFYFAKSLANKSHL